MADNNALNVSTGKPLKATGAVFSAPAGSTLPPDAVTPLDAAFKALGYVSTDGVKNNTAITTQDINAWGGDVVLSALTGYKETFAFGLIETSLGVLKEYYGEDNVSEASTHITVKHQATDESGHPWVIEIGLNGGRIKRIVIPNGKIGERGEISYTDGNAIVYNLTVNALPDSAGYSAYSYITKVV